MVIHKLIAICDCGNEACVGKDGATVNITLTATDDVDVEFLGKLLKELEIIAESIEETVIDARDLPLMRAVIFDTYRIPKLVDKMGEAFGLGNLLNNREGKKEEEDLFKDYCELELKEID